MGPTLASLAAKFPKPSEVRIAADATVLLSGRNLVVEALDVEGTLIINACDGANGGMGCLPFMFHLVHLVVYRGCSACF